MPSGVCICFLLLTAVWWVPCDFLDEQLFLWVMTVVSPLFVSPEPLFFPSCHRAGPAEVKWQVCLRLRLFPHPSQIPLYFLMSTFCLRRFCFQFTAFFLRMSVLWTVFSALAESTTSFTDTVFPLPIEWIRPRWHFQVLLMPCWIWLAHVLSVFFFHLYLYTFVTVTGGLHGWHCASCL